MNFNLGLNDYPLSSREVEHKNQDRFSASPGEVICRDLRCG